MRGELYINTDEVSAHLRSKAVDRKRKALLITNFAGSRQAEDLTEPANCKGFGRIRHFRLGGTTGWPANPLPILPAAKALGKPPDSEIRAQVFQNAVCNWRCWYCFVDYALLKGSPKHASFLTCNQMVDMYLDQPEPPSMIDLTGGQPDLTPEWVPWMMETMIERGLENKVYLWSDDNLSNDYFWRYVSEDQIEIIINYPMYSRVCCFKGIDEESFSLNTKADPKLFDNQFVLCDRLISTGLDVYAYITLTAADHTDFEMAIPKFLDRVQKVREMMPLRIVPLEILEFTPVRSRMNDVFRDMCMGQYKAMEIWKKEIQRRFSTEQRALPITEVKIN